MFTGYITCGGCGNKLSMRASKRKMKNEDGTIGYQMYRYYSCMHKINGINSMLLFQNYLNNNLNNNISGFK